jgi:hypothetical protein
VAGVDLAAPTDALLDHADALLGVPGHQVGDGSRLIGGSPPRALWRRR